MLHDPRHDKTPSLAGFALFVASKNPEEKYNWSNCMTCAVGQYLASIGINAGGIRWVGIIDDMNQIAKGDYMRGHEEWNFGKLADRILKHQMETA